MGLGSILVASHVAYERMRGWYEQEEIQSRIAGVFYQVHILTSGYTVATAESVSGLPLVRIDIMIAGFFIATKFIF